MPVRRPAALVGAATVLAAGALVGAAAAPASADGGSKGTASAVNARVDLDVSLLNGSAKVPVDVELNDVSAPKSEKATLLKAAVKGFKGGEPFTFVAARAAHSKAVTGSGKSEGYSEIAGAVVKVPGLPTPVLKAELVTAKATCAAGANPVADAKVVGPVVVLGKKVSVDLAAQAPQKVVVPGVGTVTIALEEESTTSDSAAATAVKLTVDVNPAKLNVAKVKGEVVLSEAKCALPAGDGGTGGSSGGSTDGGATNGGSGGSTDGGATAGSGGGDTDGATAGSSGGDSGGSAGNQPAPQSGDGSNLAETGGGQTLAIGGVGAALVAGGAAALWMKRRRSAASRG